MYLGIDVGVVLHEAEGHLLQAPLTGHVERRRELPSAAGPWTRGAVDVRPVPNKEAGGGRVSEEDGAVEEGEGHAVLTHVPGIGITAVHRLRGSHN